jgi:hypothetical protein
MLFYDHPSARGGNSSVTAGRQVANLVAIPIPNSKIQKKIQNSKKKKTK